MKFKALSIRLNNNNLKIPANITVHMCKIHISYYQICRQRKILYFRFSNILALISFFDQYYL
ncbi:hypothetical protein RIR_e20344_A0A2N1MNT0_9GLOM [Rhizophagus irregularis DAOM 181602=DAOM 197198]|nr:hypothetical protein RIR_e20344_A0A2N1MNT0_9GLOM [Rhizophagus irregularis DAOM 181602=DAOM 197198]